MIPKEGDTVRMTGLMKDDPNPIPVGTEGVVTYVSEPFQGVRQIYVDWEIDRSLSLLDVDPFVVVYR